MPRIVDFFDGQQSASQPVVASLTRIVTGSTGSPELITASGGISINDVQTEMIFIAGSGGAVDITKNPQIAAATTIGFELNLVGTSDTNTVTLEDGDGLKLNGGWLAEDGSILNLLWDGALWAEMSRS